MPHIDLGELKYYYEIHGEGAETITILNGLTMSTVAWAAQVKDFSPHFRVLLLDMRGQGQTDRTDEENYPLSRQADDLARLLDKLGIAKTHLFALSYGGIVAQYFALQYPDRLGRLVLADTLAWSDEVNRALHNAIVMAWEAGGTRLRFRVMLPITFGANFLKLAAPVIPVLEQAAEALPWPGTKAMMVGVLDHDLRDRLKDIRAETLLIFGEEDRFTPLHQAKLLQEGIPGATLRVIPGVGHAAPLENPPVVDRLALAFFRGEPLPDQGRETANSCC
ncbi:MAG: alpha/beta hydrolase [Rhodocyclaceae bacterium]|nr:alpha/beta hydrolase [Rhodocyclaceae bacterium]